MIRIVIGPETRQGGISAKVEFVTRIVGDAVAGKEFDDGGKHADEKKDGCNDVYVIVGLVVYEHAEVGKNDGHSEYVAAYGADYDLEKVRQEAGFVVPGTCGRCDSVGEVFQGGCWW
mmetsp:Transcript_20711/g.43522  ORF Transcript_20711/g.43522 Transcript_20711/m.43522 type:complete len:117 (+) Transcript_20711:1717-2067(+)